jgi:hypothetical protein
MSAAFKFPENFLWGTATSHFRDNLDGGATRRSNPSELQSSTY